MSLYIRNTKKLEDLNKRILRFILNEHNLSYSELLETISQVSLYNKRLASMLTTCYKCIHYERYPQYLKPILNRRSGYYSLRETDIIDLPKVMTTKYGLHSFRYEAVKRWNSLPDSCRVQDTLRKFIKSISDINFEN